MNGSIVYTFRCGFFVEGVEVGCDDDDDDDDDCDDDDCDDDGCDDDPTRSTFDGRFKDGYSSDAWTSISNSELRVCSERMNDEVTRLSDVADAETTTRRRCGSSNRETISVVFAGRTERTVMSITGDTTLV